MVFSSSLFLFKFLPLFLIIYFLTDKKYRNYVALAASLLFYAWGEPLFVFGVIGLLILDFGLAWLMNSPKISPGDRKLILIFSLIVNLGVLGYYKYSNFIAENILAVFGIESLEEAGIGRVLLPIGISFFTFQKISYIVDVYRGTQKALTDFGKYGLYIMFFPQLIAGPIVRFGEIAPQLSERESTLEKRISGLFVFVIGLSKKVLIANVIGREVDYLLGGEIAELSTYATWMAMLGYSFQIYFDFSGYSDMAIGLGRMLGFTLPENFNNPYISKNITEFWRRWHITLGAWMKDYLYIPLGGNRVKDNSVLYRNLAIVFLLSGLWHGAGWNFIFWGGFHGLFLILDRVFYKEFSEKIPAPAAIAINFMVVLIGWVFFRANSMSDAVLLLGNMIGFGGDMVYSVSFSTVFILIVAAIISFSHALKASSRIQGLIYNNTNIASILYSQTGIAIILLFFCATFIASSGFNPFIYFRF